VSSSDNAGSVYQRKDGRWCASLCYVDPATGTRKRRTVYATSEREARRRLRELRDDLDTGKPMSSSRVTVADYATRWAAGGLRVGRRQSTVTTYRHLLDGLVVPALGSHRLDRLTAAHVEAWLAGDTAHAPATMRQAHAVLCLLLDAAARDGLVGRNVARQVKRPRKPRTEADWWGSDDVAQLLDAAAGDRLEPLLTVAAFTGLRRGELLALRWSDLDLEAGALRVTGTLTRTPAGLERSEPKTAAGWRSVPLVPQAAQALERQRAAQQQLHPEARRANRAGYVFTSETGTVLDPRNASRWLEARRKDAGIGAGSWHTLRHSAASALIAAGVPLAAVGRVLGHSSITVTVDTYGHLASDDLSRLVAAGLDGYATPPTLRAV